MVRVTLVVREAGRTKPDYSLEFDLPAVPGIGSYISVQRPDRPKPYGEDMIVRQVWWRLQHPETAGFGAGQPKVGSPEEIILECEPALGPYSSDSWRKLLEGARHGRGVAIEEFDLQRVSVPESAVKPKS